MRREKEKYLKADELSHLTRKVHEDIMEKLKGFALDQILSEYQDFVKFDTCRRHGRHMVDFLLDYSSRLELAEKAGITFSNRLKTYHLLDRCDLNANMRTSVMQQMQTETEAGKKAEGPDFEVKYESVVAKLRTIGNAKDMADIVKSGAQTLKSRMKGSWRSLAAPSRVGGRLYTAVLCSFVIASSASRCRSASPLHHAW